MLCLGTVAELSQQALRKVESSAAERDQLQRIQQQIQEPCESSRMAAYDSLRTMHKDCQLCKNKEACAKGRALLIMRDLVVLTVSIGKGPMSPLTLKTALEDALRQGCGRFDLDKVEQSQLTLAFNKVISLGRTREGFDAKVRSANMYGPELTEEEVQQLFLVYNACARASPQYVSKNKESRKHRKRSASPQRELAAAASAASASAASASMPMAMSESSHSQETMCMWQLGAKTPFLHGWEEKQLSRRPERFEIPTSFDAGFDVSQVYPHVQETPPCKMCGFFDPQGHHTSRGYFCREHCAPEQPVLESAAMRREQDPLWETYIRVVDASCLLVASREMHRKATGVGPGRVGLLVFGKKEGPLDEHRQEGQAKDVLQHSNFVERIRGEGYSGAAPQQGGVGARDVDITLDSGERCTVDFMLYAVASKRLFPDSDQDPEKEDFRAQDCWRVQREMKEKMEHALRIFAKEGLAVLILGAWGCGWRGLDPSMVAKCWSECLERKPEFLHRFREVIFAVETSAGDPRSQEHFCAFRQVFDHPREQALDDPQWVFGPNMWSMYGGSYLGDHNPGCIGSASGSDAAVAHHDLSLVQHSQGPAFLSGNEVSL